MSIIELASRRPPIVCGHCEKPFTAERPGVGKGYQCPSCHWWVNEHGTIVSVHTCKTCGREYTVCPPIPVGVPDWDECLATDCASYDATRDADRFFE